MDFTKHLNDLAARFPIQYATGEQVGSVIRERLHADPMAVHSFQVGMLIGQTVVPLSEATARSLVQAATSLFTPDKARLLSVLDDSFGPHEGAHAEGQHVGKTVGEQLTAEADPQARHSFLLGMLRTWQPWPITIEEMLSLVQRLMVPGAIHGLGSFSTSRPVISEQRRPEPFASPRVRKLAKGLFDLVKQEPEALVEALELCEWFAADRRIEDLADLLEGLAGLSVTLPSSSTPMAGLGEPPTPAAK